MIKLSQRLKYIITAPLFIFAVLALQFANISFASAATVTWDGSAGDNNFNTAANWSGNSVPTNGDVLNFDLSIISSNTTLNNNVTSLSVAGITFSGTPSGYGAFTITGNSLTVTGNITSSATFSSDALVQTLNLPIVLGANIVATNVTFASTVNTQTYSLGIAGTYACGLAVQGALSGSGALNMSSTYGMVLGNNSAYSGPITISAGTTVVSPSAFGTAGAGTTVSGSGKLSIYTASAGSVAEPLTLGGTGSIGSQGDSSGFCSGSDAPKITTTLTGGVTLTSNFVLNSRNDVVISAPYTANGHTFSVAGGARGTLTTPEGSVEVPAETKNFDGDAPSTNETVGNKQTAYLNGTRGSITVADGGLLLGTGTANNIYMNEGGVINPGQSPGKLTVLNIFSTTGTYSAELLNASTYDQLAVGADYSGGGNAVSLNTGAILDVVLYDGWKINQGDAFRIIDNQSSTAVSGTFTGLSEGTQFTVTNEGVTITFSITYVGGDGNDVVITALNTGADPTPPNTGVAQLIMANPAIVIGFGLITAALLVILAVRRRSTN